MAEERTKVEQQLVDQAKRMGQQAAQNGLTEQKLNEILDEKEEPDAR